MGRSPSRSYGPSTRSNRVSHGQYVLCGVLVAVVMGTAHWAVPCPLVQSEASENVPASVAGLARGVETVNLHKGLPVAVGFVLQHADRHADRSVGNALGQAPVTNHATEVQVLDAYFIEPSDHVHCELVQMVFPGVDNPCVDPGHPQALPFPSIASLFTTGEDPAGKRQLSFGASKVMRIRHPLSIGESSEPGDAEVDPDRHSGLRELLDGLVQAEGCEVASSSVLGYRDRAGYAVELPAPTDSKPSDFGDYQVAVFRIPLERRFRVLCGLGSSFGFEGRVSAPLLEEIYKRCVEVAEGLLFGYATDLVEPEEVLVPLELGQKGGGLVVTDLLSVSVGIGASPEAPVVDEPYATESPNQDLLLSGRRIESELVAYLHMQIVAHVTIESQYPNERKEGAAIPLPAKAGSLLAV